MHWESTFGHKATAKSNAQLQPWFCAIQAAAVGRDKDWWAQKTNPSFPSAPIADYSSTTTSASAAAAPKQNPFLKGGSQEDTRVRDAPLTGDGKQTGDKKDPRKEFEAGLKGAVCLCLCLFGSTLVCTILSKALVITSPEFHKDM